LIQRASLLLLIVLVVSISGCGATALGFGGGQDRQSLAQQTVRSYWSDINRGKFGKAYAMMTSGNRAARPESSYGQNLLGFLQGTGGVKATVGKATVSGDNATVPVTLHSPKTTVPLHAYQHLFWQDNQWRISDQDGTLSQTK
jgi:hypothetical protein